MASWRVDCADALEWLAALPPGAMIDPFAGSGSSLVAAAEDGREALGCEMLPAYADTARKRLAAAVER